VPAHHLNEGGLRLAAQTAAMWRNAQIIIPAIHRRRPSPIAADSVPLTIPTAFDRFLGHQTSAPPPKPRCGAHSRRSGQPCRQPAMANGRCRMHGGLSTGAPKGNRNAFKHGRYSAEAIAGRRKIRELIRAMRALARQEQV
jgi:hypothetical protein